MNCHFPKSLPIILLEPLPRPRNVIKTRSLVRPPLIYIKANKGGGNPAQVSTRLFMQRRTISPSTAARTRCSPLLSRVCELQNIECQPAFPAFPAWLGGLQARARKRRGETRRDESTWRCKNSLGRFTRALTAR